MLEELISQGRYFEARSKAEEILQTASDVRTKQLLALAISKLGMPELALETIEPVYKQSPDDPESAGILGSIYKELFKKNQQTKFAILSRDTYQRNFILTQNYYTGINAASMSAMAGQAGQARDIAAQVIVLVEQKIPHGFWELATLGEAYLLIKNKALSAEYYVQARKMAGSDWGQVTSVHNQLWLLNHYIPVAKDVMKLFGPPNVVAFSGHMIDGPSRTTPRFPASIEQQIKESIRHSIRTMNARVGYSSLACGSDILFVESLVEEGAEVNILLPFAKEDFIKTSVHFAGAGWVDRFNKIMHHHPSSLITNAPYGGNEELFSFLGRAIYGAAILRCGATHSEPSLLTVLSDSDLKAREGGTRDTVAQWPFAQRHVNINPDIFTLNLPPVVASTSAPSFEFVKTSDRILYLVYIGLAGLPSSEFHDLIDKYDSGSPDRALRIAAGDSMESFFILAFTSESGAMEFVAHLRGSLREFRQENLIKLALHVGTVAIESRMLSGQAIEDLKEIGSHVGAGLVCASEQFAWELVLSTKSYQLHRAGVISTQGKRNWTFYNVEILD